LIQVGKLLRNGQKRRYRQECRCNLKTGCAGCAEWLLLACAYSVGFFWHTLRYSLSGSSYSDGLGRWGTGGDKPVPPRNLRRKMPKKKLTVLQAKYLEVADLFLWGRQIDFTAWFTGLWSPRNKQSETILPQLERLNVIHSKWYGGQKVYTTSKRESDAHIPHGLVCTNALLRFKLSGGGEFIPEGFFREKMFKAIPEWAVRYESNMILFEYSTPDNFRRKRTMKDKNLSENC